MSAPHEHTAGSNAPAKQIAPRARQVARRPREELAVEYRATHQATPVLKWLGGKTKLLPELTARLPARFGRYFEPFVGGAALFFRVAPERAVLADSNPDLIGLYTCLTRDVAGVIRKLEHHRTAHSESHYYTTRTRWNDRELWSSADRAATFIYLNKTCFNGLWRVNRSGAFNVGWGKHATFTPDVENLRAAALELQRAVLRTGDYRAAVDDALAGDVVYMDPPYDGTFTSYAPGSFTDVDQAEVAHLARTLDARGVHVIVSNADTPRIRALYAGWTLDRVSRQGTVSCKGAGRARVAELIITPRSRA